MVANIGVQFVEGLTKNISGVNPAEAAGIDPVNMMIAVSVIIGVGFVAFVGWAIYQLISGA